MKSKLALLLNSHHDLASESKQALAFQMLLDEFRRLQERCAEQERRLAELEEHRPIAFLQGWDNRVHFEIDL
ncbi:hypothetical protein FNU79_04000 [Deinococcus detaillensis]|uniref:Uncharacterized protein n=1 Tax=Deinococcus detaillensis TaxID=2592048 RepID=A0A553V588_9DEIO|nr:hypothetical protein [Deinococcus detaillensis]TSA87643.1 hypothetical protein FNU79_04000 [Deinococcus detaillensis]